MGRLEAAILVAAADTGILSGASRYLRIPLATARTMENSATRLFAGRG